MVGGEVAGRRRVNDKRDLRRSTIRDARRGSGPSAAHCRRPGWECERRGGVARALTVSLFLIL